MTVHRMLVSLAILGCMTNAGLGASLAYENAVLSAGATAYYMLDDAHGASTVVDSAPAANTASVSSGITLGGSSATPFLLTSAADDGTGAITVPNNGVFNVGSGAFTIEMWFNAATTSRGDLFTYKDQNPGDDFGIQSQSQGPNSVTYYHNGFLAEATGVSDSAWHYLVATRSAAGAVSLYIDNHLAATATDTASINSTNIALIGANHDNMNSLAIPFNGSIDEFAFYPKALSTATIDAHFRLGTGTPEPSAFILGGLGAGALLLAVRRRRKA